MYISNLEQLYISLLRLHFGPRNLQCLTFIFNLKGSTLTVQEKVYKLNSNVYVVGFGKAVSGMARAVEDLVGGHIVRGVISVPYGTRQLFSTIGKESVLKKNVEIIVKAEKKYCFLYCEKICYYVQYLKRTRCAIEGRGLAYRVCQSNSGVRHYWKTFSAYPLSLR